MKNDKPRKGSELLVQCPNWVRGGTCRLLLHTTSSHHSVLVAEEWKLPKDLILALKQQESKHRGELAHTLFLANVNSEIHLLIQSGKLEVEEGVGLLVEKGPPKPYVCELFDMMNKVDSH